jgi:hypothetical protein
MFSGDDVMAATCGNASTSCTGSKVGKRPSVNAGAASSPWPLRAYWRRTRIEYRGSTDVMSSAPAQFEHTTMSMASMDDYDMPRTEPSCESAIVQHRIGLTWADAC